MCRSLISARACACACLCVCLDGFLNMPWNCCICCWFNYARNLFIEARSIWYNRITSIRELLNRNWDVYVYRVSICLPKLVHFSLCLSIGGILLYPILILPLLPPPPVLSLSLSFRVTGYLTANNVTAIRSVSFKFVSIKNIHVKTATIKWITISSAMTMMMVWRRQ